MYLFEVKESTLKKFCKNRTIHAQENGRFAPN